MQNKVHEMTFYYHNHGYNNKEELITCVDKDVEQLDPPRIASDDVKWYS
jgi:hypothetical protein